MTATEIADAEEAVGELVDVNVARLVRPVLQPDHAPIVERVERLPWSAERFDFVADMALTILTEATTSCGPLDPADDDADVAWARMLGKMTGAPIIGSKMGRRWFAHVERLLRQDAPVSAVSMAVAAYAVAKFEDASGHHHEAGWWARMASVQTETDDRAGLGLAVAVRAAHLLSWRAT